MNAPKLQCTKNYELFDAHEGNRPLHEDKILLESLQTRGFMPSNPIQVIRNGNGKLKIIRGHHRFTYAKRLGIAVFYVIDDSALEPYEMALTPDGMVTRIRRTRGGALIGVWYSGVERLKRWACMYCLTTHQTEAEACACSDRCYPEWERAHPNREGAEQCSG